jgi:5'(3')-deoxyribonucleotidase
MTIFIDMDNTLVDTLNGSLIYVEKIIEKKLPRLDHREVESDLTNVWLELAGIDKDKAAELRLRIFHDAFFWETLPFYDFHAYGVFKRLYEKHDVYIATSVFKTNSEECYVGKVRWIKRNLPWFDVSKIIYSHQKYLLRGDVMIEDSLSQLELFQGNRIVMNAGWNTTYKISSYKSFFANNWVDVEESVKFLEK